MGYGEGIRKKAEEGVFEGNNPEDCLNEAERYEGMVLKLLKEFEGTSGPDARKGKLLKAQIYASMASYYIGKANYLRGLNN